MDRVRVGVIGAGWVAGARHVPALQRADGAALVAVFDPVIDHARRVAPEGVLATDDLDAFYRAGLDAVHVCAPPGAHAPHTIEALSRRCHVFCEKPMAVARAEADAMTQAASDADRLLCVTHNLMWSNAVLAARRRLATPGTVRHVRAVQLSSDRRRLPTWRGDYQGGLVFDEVPHLLYLMEDLLGGNLEVEDVRAEWAGRAHEPQSCDVRLRGDLAPGQLTIVHGAPVPEWRVTAVAERDVVDVDLYRDVMVAGGAGDGSGLRPRTALRHSASAAGRHLIGVAGTSVRLVRRRQLFGHDRLVASFVDAVRSGGPSPVPLGAAMSVARATDIIVGSLKGR
ncbi:MAG: Gfo/Idh/MocA family oxidoreductase [Acidimicrobiales bacterium]|nr:Gfo/Idh/MocA family oxidoreductase [Acidimicrobiales bacterium]